MSKSALILVGSACVLLAGCGSGGSGEGGASGEAAETASTGGMPADWKATDACSIVDKAEMAEVMKAEVAETSLGLVHEPDGATAATSECTYALKDGGTVTVMTRWSPIADNTPETIAATRSASASALKAFSDKALEDVPGVGKAAFMVPGINQFTVFLDDSRMMVISLGSVPAGEEKDRAIALVGTAGG